MNFKSRQLSLTFLSLILFIAVMSACQAAPARPVPDDFQVRFERSECFGTCPVYALTVSADGEVVYEGLRFVDVEGRQTATLTDVEVMALYRAIQSANFFEFEGNYAYQATDLPTATTTVTAQGRTHTVSRYGGTCGSDLDVAPPALCGIEALLEAIPVSNGWIVGE